MLILLLDRTQPGPITISPDHGSKPITEQPPPPLVSPRGEGATIFKGAKKNS